MNTLAIFDFDGTLTKKDTLLELIRFKKGRFLFWLGFLKLSPIILLHLFRIMPNWKAKQYVLRHFFSGVNTEDFRQLCSDFSKECIPELIKPEALEKFKYHIENGHEVVVVSASAENWLSQWCKDYGVKLIATQLEVVGKSLSGNIVGENCHGPEKLSRLKKEYNLEDFNHIYVYGDSKGDREILAIATHPFYRKY